MARGRFGRHRRGTGQNLTLLIAQLVREQRAAEDRAIFDAYQNGGQFQGKPVDDTRILAYIQARRDGFDTKDPLWDQWNNTLVQQKFSIGEQKIGLAFKEGRASASQVAAFYRSQLDSIPKDSEFYREVSGRAAEWAKSAGAAARGAAQARLAKQIEAAQKQHFDTYNAFGLIEQEIAKVARQRGLISGTQGVTNANATALQNLLDSGAVTGADGTPITYAEWQQATVAAYQSLGTIIKLGEQAGYKYEKERGDREELWYHITDINALDDRTLYETAQAQWSKDVAAAQGDPYATAEANRKYLEALGKLRASALQPDGSIGENNADFIGGIENEIKALTGTQPSGGSVTDLFTGGANNHAAQLFAATQALDADIKLLDSGQGYLGQTDPWGELSVIPFGPGQGIDELGRLTGVDFSVQPAVSEVNGVQRNVYMKGVPVTAVSFIDTETGQPVPASAVTREALANGSISRAGEGSTIGYVFADPGSGDFVYGVLQSDGSMVFTENNPFNNFAQGNNGFEAVADTIEVEQGGKPAFVPDSASAIGQITSPSFAITGKNVSNEELLRLAEEGKVAATPDQLDSLRKTVQIQKDAQARQGARFKGEGASAIKEPGDITQSIPQLAPLADSLRQLYSFVQSQTGGGSFNKADARNLGAPPTITKDTAPLKAPTLGSTPKPTTGPAPIQPLSDYGLTTASVGNANTAGGAGGYAVASYLRKHSPTRQDISEF